MKCNVCGSTNLIEGKIIGADGGESIFVSNDKSFFKRILGIESRKIHSYACVRCQNLQFTVDFTEADRQKYFEFEGQQPSLLERLSEEDERKTGKSLPE